jgi:hypothetical protein
MKMMFKNPILWWRHEGRYYHKDIYRGIKNLIAWFPVIWKDRNWDHCYIYKVLQFKLEQQAYYIGSRDRHTTAKRDVEKMLLCARMCQIQQDSLYEMEYMDYEDRRIEFVPMPDYKIDGESCYEMKSTLLHDNLDEYFAKYPRQYRRALSGEINMFKTSSPEDKTRELIAMEIAHENQKRSRQLLFKILDDNIERFWD